MNRQDRAFAAIIGGLMLATLAAGCAMTPAYTKTVTTLGEVDTTGLVCRRPAPTGSYIPKTICASQAAWDKRDAADAAASARLHDDANRNTNNDPFSRGRN